MKTSLIFSFSLLLLQCGCVFNRTAARLPENDRIVRDQLVIFTDFHLPRRHRLLDELTAERNDISRILSLPTSDEPISIYLFENEKSYGTFMKENHPDYPNRRALFVKNDATLKIYAYWGERVGEDLRHEVAHGYLHSVVPNLPLWLDEGLAEFFEVGRGKHGLNRSHISTLAVAFKNDEWTPNLELLEALTVPEDMTQMQYAESWLWIHYLLETTPENRKIVQDQLARFRMSGEANSLLNEIRETICDPNDQAIQHLETLVDSLNIGPSK